MSRTFRLTLGLLAVAASSAYAQEPTPPAASLATGPTLERSSVAFRMPAAPADADPALPATHAAFTRGQALMIVGGATLLAGLIIGGDAGTAVAVGGALIGVYGLYLYLKTSPAEGSGGG